MKNTTLKILTLLTTIAITLAINACGGNDSTPTQTGVFTDTTVTGLDYNCSSGNIGVTNNLGEFTCNEDDSVTFYLGNIELGTTKLQEYVTPYSLFNGDKVASLNLAQLLQTLDSDGDITNGITIDEDLLASLGEIDFTSPTFDEDIQKLLGDAKTLVSEDEALKHIVETFEALNINADGSSPRTQNPPSIISVNTVFVDENQKSAITIEAIDDNNDTLTYSISSGDADKFSIDTQTGVVTFKETQKSKTKVFYIFTAKVSDGILSDTQDITILINDFLEVTYSWESENWRACSGGCGLNNATQTRAVTCKSSTGVTVADSTCKQTKPTITQACTASICTASICTVAPVVTYAWYATDWGTCSGGCGLNNATQTRAVTCKSSTGVTVADSMCTQTKYLTSKACTASSNCIPTITSPTTGYIWMDRNLGASQACTSFNDTACYGDYYQWGRDADGHEKSNSTTVEVTSSQTSVNPGHGKFITDDDNSTDDGAFYDWISNDADGSKRASWNPCPSGFRIPTRAEIDAEHDNGNGNGIANRSEAFDKLKLPSAGFRRSAGGSLSYQGSGIWSSGVSGSYSDVLGFNSTGAGTGGGDRAYGRSVRCFKD